MKTLQNKKAESSIFTNNNHIFEIALIVGKKCGTNLEFFINRMAFGWLKGMIQMCSSMINNPKT